MSGLIHDALIYDSNERFADAMAPFLVEGLEHGEGVVAATSQRNEELLRTRLGRDAGRVLFVRNDDFYTKPAAAIAGYDRVLASFRTVGAPRVRAIGEVSHGRTEVEQRAWLRYESVAHSVFAQAPLWVVCPYDTRALPGWLVEHARVTHPRFAGEQGSNPSFADPASLLDSLEQPQVLVPQGEPLARLEVQQDMTETRVEVANVLALAGLRPPRLDEAVVAVNELVTNTRKHGADPATVTIWAMDRGIVCEVSDAGPGIADPLAGFRPPDPGVDTGRMGLWIAGQLADAFTVGEGATVRLSFLRERQRATA